MTVQEAIEYTKNKGGFKVCFSGCVTVNGRGRKLMREELSKHFSIAREAWLSGDIETVAEFFGLYV